VQCCDGIYRDMSPRQQVYEALRPLKVVAVAFHINFIHTLYLWCFNCFTHRKILKLEVPSWRT